VCLELSVQCVLLLVPCRWQLLEEVGFVSVRAEDRTELFVRMLKKELKRLTDSHDEFVKACLFIYSFLIRAADI